MIGGFKARVRISEVADSADEQVSHGEEDHGFEDVEAAFVVTHEATVTGSPFSHCNSPVEQREDFGEVSQRLAGRSRL